MLLERVAVPFDHDDEGELSLVREGGHTLPRIVHVADATGKSIELALTQAIESHPNITLLTGFTAVDLLTPSHHSVNRLAVYDPACVRGRLSVRAIQWPCAALPCQRDGAGNRWVGPNLPAHK